MKPLMQYVDVCIGNEEDAELCLGFKPDADVEGGKTDAEGYKGIFKGRYWMQKENIPLENVLVVVDDLALPFGTLRLKGKGSDAGHNGLKHIAATLGTQNYARLRFGIGNDFPRGGQVDFVLGHFTDEDWKTMDERLKMAGEIIKSFCLAGIDITMNQFNKK